ncbi:condensation domain-containing protein [Xenorhabdus indica]|uniref:condensation domain-containing protein n=1 Tax=Xenorhabdus indica TaxID=333964 RepID=UPI0021D51312|nr:condensation domain-containing protein [Xenorhabdus indica]
MKPFALSEAQNSRWFQYQINPTQRGKNNSAFCARVKGLTAERLETAMNHLIKRHPMLRSKYLFIIMRLPYFLFLSSYLLRLYSKRS